MISTPFGGWREVSSPVSAQRRQPSSASQLELESSVSYDTVVVTIRPVNGTLGIVDGSCPVGFGYDTRAEVLGTDGVLLGGQLSEHALVRCTREEGAVTRRWTAWAKRFEVGYLAQYEHSVAYGLARHPWLVGRT